MYQIEKKIRNNQKAQPKKLGEPPIPKGQPFALLKLQRFWWICNVVLLIGWVGMTVAIFVAHHRLQGLQTTIAKEGKTQRNPQDIAVRKELAGDFERQGSGKKAEEDYRRAIAVDPNNAELHFALGSFLMGIPERQQEAMEHLQKAVAIKPDHPKRKAIELWIKTTQSQEKGKGK